LQGGVHATRWLLTVRMQCGVEHIIIVAVTFREVVGSFTWFCTEEHQFRTGREKPTASKRPEYRNMGQPREYDLIPARWFSKRNELVGLLRLLAQLCCLKRLAIDDPS
uniref:Transposase n=1 Tax=Heligmosomoides polygyrus TaxID=6339 RepID=A0A183GSG9_HELPZ